MSRWTIASVYVSIACLAVTACSGSMGERFRPLSPGDPVPVYSVVTLSGDSVHVGPDRQEPLTLMNVWATWCIPCRKEFPDLQRIHTDYSSRGLRVVAVSIDSPGDVDKIREFASRYSATFTIAHDHGAVVRDRYRSIGIPETYLISPDGKLLFRNPGAFPEGAANLRAEIEKALAR